MRVNVYAEEMTDRVEVIAKQIENENFTGLRFYLELPATVGGQQHRGPFMHRPGDDDSAAVTFWGKRDLRTALRRALSLLDAHYDGVNGETPPLATSGADWQGGIYIGRTLDDGEPAELVLLPDEFKGTWNDAKAWAEKHNAVLPSRIDLLVLWAKARAQFQEDWYWSSEQHAGGPEWAWSQTFTNGTQDATRKCNKLRARAVRRVPIQ